MQVVAQKDDPRIRVSRREQILVKPFLQAVAGFERAHGRGVLDVIQDDEVWPVVLEAHPAHRLVDGDGGDLCVLVVERQRRRVPRRALLVDLSEVALEEPVRLELALDTVKELLRLILRFRDEHDEVLLLASENRPERIGQRDDRRLSATAERLANGEPVVRVFGKVEELLVDVCTGVGEVVRKVGGEEGAVRLIHEHEPRRLVAENQVHCFLIHELVGHMVVG